MLTRVQFVIFHMLHSDYNVNLDRTETQKAYYKFRNAYFLIYIPRGKGGRCVRLTTSTPFCAERHGIWEPKPPGTLWATPGLLRDSFTSFSNIVVKFYKQNLRNYLNAENKNLVLKGRKR